MFRNLFALCVTLSFSFSVMAKSDVAKPISWETAKGVPGFMPEAVALAGDSVEFLDNGSACSGQFLSTKGFYLTAMHCVMGSILNEGPALTYPDVVTGPFYKGWYVRDMTQLPYQTKEVEDATKLRAPGETAAPIVLSLGHGYFEFPPLIKTNEEFDSVLSKKSEFSIYQEDYAVLKFDLQKPKNHSCITLSPKEPVSGSDVWAIGFPDTFLRTGKDPQKFVVKARVFQTLAELKASRHEFATYSEEAWVDSKKVFFIDGTIVSGMSGGAVLNSDGQIIGTIIGRIRSSDGIVEKSTFVVSELKKRFGEKEFADNFACTK